MIDGHATLVELEAVAADLDGLEHAPFFFGASVLPLYLDTPALAEEARPTEEVDAILTVLTVLTAGPFHLATAALEG